MNQTVAVRAQALQVFEPSDVAIGHVPDLFQVVVYLDARFAVLARVGFDRV
jgi:hypothetical protein